MAAADFSTTLLFIPCSGGKRGAPDPRLPIQRVSDYVGRPSAQSLLDGIAQAFTTHRASVDVMSPLEPAIAVYSGFPYATAGFRDRLIPLLNRGLHCLIVSGGYGLVRPEEPIHRYRAQMSSTTRVWESRLPSILRDYVHSNGIRRTFGAFSSTYANVVPSNLTEEDWRAVPTFSRYQDAGVAMRVVPQRVGHLLVSLLEAGLTPTAGWKLTDWQQRGDPVMPDPLRNPGGSSQIEASIERVIPAGPVPVISAQDIREFLIRNFVQPARLAGHSTCGPLRAGDIHRQLGLRRRQPLVCSVMDGQKFQDEAGVCLVQRDGSRQGASASYFYQLL